jgi:hypothetical protein
MTMRKLLAVPCLFVLLILGACSSNQPLGPGVTQAKADLHVAELNFSRAQAAVISLAKAGVLKGSLLASVKTAEGVAYEAIKVARASVDAGRTDAASVVSTALAKVLELVALYTAGK